MQLDPRNIFHLLPATLATNPDAIVALPVFAPHDPDSTLVLWAKRHTRRIPPELAARIAQAQAAESGHGHGNGNGASAPEPVELPTHLETGRLLLMVPADVADNLRGPVSERHVMYLVLVRRDVYDDAWRQATSGIILPTTANAGGRPIIVKP